MSLQSGVWKVTGSRSFRTNSRSDRYHSGQAVKLKEKLRYRGSDSNQRLDKARREEPFSAEIARKSPIVA